MIKITEKKEERDKRLVNDCSFQGHLPSAGRWDEGNPPSTEALQRRDVSASVIHGKIGFSQPIKDLREVQSFVVRETHVGRGSMRSYFPF